MSKNTLKVAMIGTPWIEIPPSGYGGTEAVLQFLIPELRKLGVTVELFSVGTSKVKVDKLHSYFDEGQYGHIHKLLSEALPLPVTHILFALKTIKESGDFDIIHDHNGYAEAAAMAYLDNNIFPPALQTIHGPFSTDDMVANGMPDNRPMYEQLSASSHIFFNGISQSQLSFAPKSLGPRLLGSVFNPVNAGEYPFKAKKDEYFITLARFNRDKGQHIAAKLCDELGYKLKMAGIVGGIDTTRKLSVELANISSPMRNNPDFAYFRDQVLPLLIPGQIEYVGNMAGQAKLDFVSCAKALLFPIDWEEPFGMAVIEAMACGTPVVAYRRGAMPELIEHGVSGFLADTEAEFKDYMTRVSEIDPAACRAQVVKKFSAAASAQQYLDIYRQVIKLTN